MKAYGVSRPGGPMQSSDIKAAADRAKLNGTAKRPNPPRDLKYLASSRSAIITWVAPELSDDIVGWRIYKETELKRYSDISDPSTKQVTVELSSGTTPPVTNIFVTAVNAAGIESRPVLIQAQATAETGAPSVPSVPTEWVDTKETCVEIDTQVEVPDGTTELVLKNYRWVGIQFGEEPPLYATPETLVSVFVRAKDLIFHWWDPRTWFRPRLHIETGQDGQFTPKYSAWREFRNSYLVKRTCPGGTYRAGYARTRVHNAKAPYYYG